MTTLAGKRVLIITASTLQVPVIRKAQAMGLEVVATDSNAQAPGLKIADYAEVVDTLDLDAVLSVARKHGVSGVLTEGTDVAVATAAYVAENMGLPGIGYDVAVAATNKWLMRERCRAAGISGPQYRRVSTLDEALSAASAIGLPIVIKPVDSQGSRGVAKIWSAADIPKWFAKACSYSRDGSALVEEMMSGTESSVESFVTGDQVRVLGVCDKTKCAPPYSYDTRLVYPGFFPDEVMAEIEALNERVVKAVGITMGLTHAEYIVDGTGVRLLEIAARGCGARVVTHLIPAMTGLDPIRARIRQGLGLDADLGQSAFQKSGVLEFLLLPPGTITSIAGLDEARRIPGVIEVGYNLTVGDNVGVIDSGQARPGYLLAVGKSRSEVLAIVDAVQNTIEVVVSSSGVSSPRMSKQH